MEFHLVQNRQENCHHDHIPFNLKGNGKLDFSVCVVEKRLRCVSLEHDRTDSFLLKMKQYEFSLSSSVQFENKSTSSSLRDVKVITLNFGPILCEYKKLKQQKSTKI